MENITLKIASATLVSLSYQIFDQHPLIVLVAGLFSYMSVYSLTEMKARRALTLCFLCFLLLTGITTAVDAYFKNNGISFIPPVLITLTVGWIIYYEPLRTLTQTSILTIIKLGVKFLGNFLGNKND